MHDIDRTQLEMEYEGEYEQETYPEFEVEGEYEDEFEAEAEGEYEAVADTFGEFEFEVEYMDSPFSDAEEMELAAELLEIYDEAELEQFLGKLIKRASRKVGRFMKSSTGRALRSTLRGLARKALPIAGGAIGTFFGGPAGGALGARAASTAGRIFGLELEGMSPEDQEFELARRYVRFSGEAAKQAALAPKNAPTPAVVRTSVTKAAQKYAPGLAAGAAAVGIKPIRRSKRSGRWVRRGRNIILLGV
jgi:uncharacterized protein (DUF697 family)